MVNNIFKGLLLIAIICIIAVLYDIAGKLENGRFQSGQGDKVLDTRKGIIYFYSANGYVYFDKGVAVKVPMGSKSKPQELPRD